MITARKVFFGFADIEKWLNAQGEKSLLLISVNDGKFIFEETESPIKYFVDHTDDSPFTDSNRAYIDEKISEGYNLACIDGRTLYFYSNMEKEDYSKRFKNMLSHARLVLLSALSVFAFSMGIMLYEMNQMRILENAVFENITPRTVALIMVIPAAVSLGISVIYFFETIYLNRKKKEVTVLEQANSDKTEQGSEGIQSDPAE